VSAPLGNMVRLTAQPMEDAEWRRVTRANRAAVHYDTTIP
jgi:hypothetical protein